MAHMDDDQLRALRAKALDLADPIGQALAIEMLVDAVRRLRALTEDCPVIHTHCGQEPDYRD